MDRATLQQRIEQWEYLHTEFKNPTIYTFFSRLGMVTGIGSGVYRTIQLVRQATGKEPGIFVEGNELAVSLPRQPDSA